MDLYPFRYRDPVTGRLVSARYMATREQIAERYAEFEITGPAEARGKSDERWRHDRQSEQTGASPD